MSERISGTLSQTNVTVTGTLANTAKIIIGGLNSISSHTNLSGRDAPEQHPISSITNLEPELEYRPSVALTNADIQAILEM